MTHAHPIPGLDALDSLAHRARHTAPDEPGATSVLAVILLQIIILIVAPYHPTGQVPPPCVTLFSFLDGDDFNLTAEFATILRDILIPLVDALPWPYPDDTDDEAGNEVESERGTESKPGAKSGATKPIPTRIRAPIRAARRPAASSLSQTPHPPRAAMPAPPARPARKNTRHRLAPSHALIVPVSKQNPRPSIRNPR